MTNGIDPRELDRQFQSFRQAALIKMLQDKDDLASLIQSGLRSRDHTLVARCLGIAVAACGLSTVARRAGITRQGLHKATGKRGNPRLATLMSILDAVELEVAVQPSRRRVRSVRAAVRCLGVAVTSKGLNVVARRSGITRQGLKKAIGREANPRLDTLISIMEELKVEITVQPKTRYGRSVDTNVGKSK
jgi:probable addiction module antidote protein